MQPELEPSKKPDKPKQTSGLMGALPVMALAAIACVSLIQMESTSQKSTDTASATQLAANNSSQSDQVATSQQADIEAQFIKYTAKLQKMDVNDRTTREALLKAPYLQKEDAQKLIQATQDGQTQIGSLTLWDNFDEDGDVVQVSTAGLNVTVPLMHASQTFYVPFRRSEPIHITGIRDGGGGITAAISTASGAVPLPLLAVGQTIVIPNF